MQFFLRTRDYQHTKPRKQTVVKSKGILSDLRSISTILLLSEDIIYYLHNVIQKIRTVTYHISKGGTDVHSVMSQRLKIFFVHLFVFILFVNVSAWSQ